MLAPLRLVTPARRHVESLERPIIQTALINAVPWQEIAEALGLRTPQAAQQCWQRLGGRVSLYNPADYD